jgi:hypothetical protein
MKEIPEIADVVEFRAWASGHAIDSPQPEEYWRKTVTDREPIRTAGTHCGTNGYELQRAAHP